MTGLDLVEDLARRGFVDLVEVGHGGFAVVYRALQQEYGRTVALKVLSGGVLDEASLERFNRELRAMGSLSNHPNIVTVYSAGVTNRGWAYLVMEYVSRGSLADRLVRSGPLPWEEAAEVGVKLAAALETSHRLGVLHRDVKPENVLLSPFGEPLLGDFGIALVTGTLVTSSNVQKVTIAHAPPEVFDGERQSAQADVYSLASTLMTLVLGHAPFVRPGDESILPLYARISREPPPDLRPLGVPPPFAEALERAMAKDPEQRQASALDFGQALRAAQRACGLSPTTMPIGGDEDDQPEGDANLGDPLTRPLARPATTEIPQRTRTDREPAAAALSVARSGADMAPPLRHDPAPRQGAPTPAATAAGDRPAPARHRGRRTAALVVVPAVGAVAVAALLVLRDDPTPVPVPNDGLSVGEDVLVVAGEGEDRSLLRFDSVTGELLDGPANDFPLEGLQAVAEGEPADGSQVWGLNAAARRVGREGLTSTQDETGVVAGDPEAIEVAGEQVWIAHAAEQMTLVSIFSTDGTFLSESPAGERPAGARAASLDVEAGVGWVASGSSEVTRITADGTTQPFVLDQRALAVAAAGDVVFVATEQGEVLRFSSTSEVTGQDGGTGVVDADRLVVTEGRALDQIVTDGATVWVAGPGTGVWRAPAGLDGTAEQLDVTAAGPKVLALGPTGLWIADPERGSLHHVMPDGSAAGAVDLAAALRTEG